MKKWGAKPMFEQLLNYLDKYRGRVIGIALGLILGWMILHYGWLATLFWIICIGVGYIIGKRIDEHESWQDVLERIFPRK